MLLIGNCYRAPSFDHSFWDRLRARIVRALEEHLKALWNHLYHADITYLLGDVNFSQIDWTLLTSACTVSSSLIELSLNLNLFQVLTQLTRGLNILDLIFTTAPITVISMTCLDELRDHKLLQIAIIIPLSVTGVPIKQICEYNRANYDCISA